MPDPIGLKEVSTGKNTSRYGMLTVKSNDQLVSEEALERAKQDEINAQSKPEIAGMALHVKDAWQRNKLHRQRSGVDERILSALRQRESEYDSDKYAAIMEQGGTEVFMGLTALKCRAGEAWLRDILADDQEKPWSLDPTPLPELPQHIEQGIVESTLLQVQQHMEQGGEQVSPEQIKDLAASMRDEIEDSIQMEADTRAARMDKFIHDQQVEGGWRDAFSDFITNFVTFPAAFIKGPIIRNRSALAYTFVNGKTGVKVKNEIAQEFECPSAFDIYPSAGAVSMDDGDLIERMRYSGVSLLEMKGLPGWNDEAIDLVLSLYRDGGLREWTAIDQERSELEDHGPDRIEQRDWMEALEYWGAVSGETLQKEGMEKDIHGNAIIPIMEYEMNVILIGDYVVYSGLNQDLLGRRPYSKASWSVIPGSFWGKGVPAMMADLQSICNATIRALVNNEAVGSGPQVVYNDVGRIPSGEDITNLFPFKTHQFTNQMNSQLKPIDFFQPKINAAELLGVYQKFADMADDYTGIPSYAHGNDNVGGAGRTMGGLSMLMSNAARGMKMVIGRVDDKIIRDVIMRQFHWNMLFEPDESIKGDIEIVARGALAQIVKESMNSRRVEYLNATNNETDRMLTGLEGRRLALKETAKSLDIPGQLVRSKEEVAMLEQQLQDAQIAATQEEAQAQAGAAA